MSEPFDFDAEDEFSEKSKFTSSQPTSCSQPSTFKAQNILGVTPPRNRKKKRSSLLNSAQSLLKSGNQMVFADDIEYIFEASLPNNSDMLNKLEVCAENLITATEEFTTRICDKDQSQFREFLRDNHCILENVVSQYLDTPTAKEAQTNPKLKTEFYMNAAILAHVQKKAKKIQQSRSKNLLKSLF